MKRIDLRARGSLPQLAGEGGAKRRMGCGLLLRPKSDCTTVTVKLRRSIPAFRTPYGLRPPSPLRGEGEARHRKRPAVAGALARRKGSIIADQRGAVAFETIIVYLFMVTSLLLPLADVAAAGFQLISAWEALRSFGQYLQYNTPPDPTNTTTWQSNLQTMVAGYTISNIRVMCGDANTACSSGNVTLTPKYYTYTTTVTLSPILLRSVLCPSSCTYTLPYSERFQ